MSEIKYLVDIEHHHEVVVESVHAGAEPCPTRIEIDGIGLIGVAREPEHVADLVDDEAVELAAFLDANGQALATSTAAPPPWRAMTIASGTAMMLITVPDATGK